MATAAHHAFELGNGAGLVLQWQLGLPGAAAAWAALFPLWFRASVAARRRSRALAFAAGAALGHALLHYSLWPWSLRSGLPVLEQADGIDERRLPLYNALVLGWSLSGVLAVAAAPPRARRYALLGLAVMAPLRGDARRHFVWLAEEARVRPAWWNRAGRNPKLLASMK